MSSTSNGIEIPSYLNEQCWVTIEEMPVWNWHKIIETGDLSYLFKREKDVKFSPKLASIWIDLQQQHMNEFGIDNALISRIKTMRKLVNLNLKFYETRDRSLLNLIKIEESRLDETNNGIKTRFYKVLDYVSSYKGFRINAKEYTVIEWYHALQNMSVKHGKDDKGQRDNRG